ncbi:translocation protein SEC63 [Nematocida sp. LUAm3]|nr:translocation protein SEC63 [Nematocida sp. LUAm3]KAI5173890.1 translocation protein SEC63 [Nematocida sp. LUAm2]KAI5177365.1 translocation protein SEC63 [Nematocida sp. LUAm1]
MNSEHAYDTSGVSSSLLGIGLLVPVVLLTYIKGFSKGSTSLYRCTCHDCLQRKKSKRQINVMQVLFFSSLFLLLFPIKHTLFSSYQRAGTFDPYHVLGLSKYSTDKQIERAYRLRVRESKLKIKDKKKSNEVVQEIQRAHEVLIDKKLREKWDTFGDEEVKEKHTVAIPHWLMTKNSSLILLLGYLILLYLIVPRSVSAIWKVTFNYSVVGLSYRTTELLYQKMKYVKKCYSVHTLLQWIHEASQEIKQHKWKSPLQNSKALSRYIEENLGIPLNKENSEIHYVIAYSVLCVRDTQILSMVHEEDLEHMQDILVKGAKAVRAISLSLKQKEIYYLSYDLERCIVQGVPDPKYWNLQYPDVHFEDLFLKSFEGKKYEEEKSEAAKLVDKEMFKSKISSISIYNAVDGVITKEEYVSGGVPSVLRVIVTQEHVKPFSVVPPTKRIKRQEADYSDLSLLEEDEHVEHNPKELDKSPVLLRNAKEYPLHAPFFYSPQVYLWTVIIEINGAPVMECPLFTPGPDATEIFFKLPSFNSLSASPKAIIDIRLFSTNFFSRDTMQRKTITLK